MRKILVNSLIAIVSVTGAAAHADTDTAYAAGGCSIILSSFAGAISRMGNQQSADNAVKYAVKYNSIGRNAGDPTAFAAGQQWAQNFARTHTVKELAAKADQCVEIFH